MNEKKICFISCVNDEILYNECVKYINNLYVPEGFEIELKKVTGARSMTEGYNEAMNSSDAKYKVYLHQDTSIINKNFIFDILRIFNKNLKIGLIGVIGAKTFSINGKWENSFLKCGKIYCNVNGTMGLKEYDEVNGQYEKVKTVDGAIMCTQFDINWREDIFKEWNFYSISQSIEFAKREYNVVVAKQSIPWCIHDCEEKDVPVAYVHYNAIFFKEYVEIVEKFLSRDILEDNQVNDYELVCWRNIYKHNVKTENNNYNKIEEYLIKKYNMEITDNNELFNFDKFQALQVLLKNRNIFNNMLHNAEKYIICKDYENTSRCILKSAQFACQNHPGFYTSSRIEKMLLECSHNLPNISMNIELPKTIIKKRKVLHVLSEGYPVGGHSRLVKNWIMKDKDSVHSLIITWQSRTLPEWLKDEVVKSGGEIYSLNNYSSSFLERASILRKIAYEWADIVVLHIHMNDPIPVMAFGVDGGPPVIFLNHADHCFWIGSSIIDYMANIRDEAQKLSLKRRNVQNNSILPIPLNYNKSFIDKKTAKKQLGIKEDTKIILSIASAWKYKSFNQYHITDFLKQIIEQNKNTIAIVVGPQNDGIWKKVYDETNGRITAVGIKKQIDIYYYAADIYFDSYFIGSLTSTLEAGLNGLPVVSLKNCNSDILGSEDLALNNRFKSSDEFIKYINKNLKDDQFRQVEGRKSLEEIKKYHVDLWNKYLENLYNKVKNTSHKISLSNSQNEVIEIYDLLLALCYK